MTAKSSHAVQREHEINEAYKAAKKLEERLEMAGFSPRPARRIREEMAAELIVRGVPMADFSREREFDTDEDR